MLARFARDVEGTVSISMVCFDEPLLRDTLNHSTRQATHVENLSVYTVILLGDRKYTAFIAKVA